VQNLTTQDAKPYYNVQCKVITKQNYNEIQHQLYSNTLFKYNAAQYSIKNELQTIKSTKQ